MRHLTSKRLRGGSRSASISLSGLEFRRTEHVLAVYERLFGPLDSQSKRRIIRTARAHGWDRTWGEPAAT